MTATRTVLRQGAGTQTTTTARRPFKGKEKELMKELMAGEWEKDGGLLHSRPRLAR